MAMVTRKIRHKNGDGSIVEAEIGAKAENVLEDENHRFATDAEKTSWNGKVDSDGGDIANTKVSEFTASSAQWPVPVAGESPKTLWGKVKKFIEDFKNWMAGVCLIGQIVNNCVTNNANLPLSAAQGKVLMDLYTVLNAKLSLDNDQKLTVGYGNDGNFYLTLYTSSGERRQITLTADRFYYGYNDVSGQWHDIWHLSPDIEIEMGSYLGNGQGTQSFNAVKLSKVENGFITQGPGSIARGINGSLGSQWDCGADSNENGLTYYYVLFGTPK